MAVVLGVGLMGCPNDTTDDNGNPNKFEGAWVHPNPQASNATYTFTDDKLTYKRDDFVQVSGTFTFDDTTLTITFANGDKSVYTYNFEDGPVLNLVYVSGDGSKYYQGPFNKQ
jgi:hypothetical protein